MALLWRRGRYEAVSPLTGRRARVDADSAEEFEERAVMFYRPLPERPLGRWQLLRFGLFGTRTDIRRLVLTGLVTVALGSLVPVATGRVLGVYVPEAETGLIVQVSLAVIITGVVSAAFMLLQNLTILRMEGRIESTLQPAVWDRLLRLPTKFFTERSTGELASAAMGVSAIRRVLSGTGPVVVQAGTLGAMNLGLLLWFSVPLALTAVAMLVVIAAVFLTMGMWELRWQRRLVELGNKLNNQAFQTLRGLPKLRVAAAESFAYGAWAAEFARSRELQKRVRPDQESDDGAQRGLSAAVFPGRLHAAGRSGARLAVGERVPDLQHVRDDAADRGDPAHRCVRVGRGRPADVRADQAGARRGTRGAGGQHAARAAVRGDRGEGRHLPLHRRRPRGPRRRVTGRAAG